MYGRTGKNSNKIPTLFAHLWQAFLAEWAIEVEKITKELRILLHYTVRESNYHRSPPSPKFVQPF